MVNFSGCLTVTFWLKFINTIISHSLSMDLPLYFTHTFPVYFVKTNFILNLRVLDLNRIFFFVCYISVTVHRIAFILDTQKKYFLIVIIRLSF